MTLPAPGSSNSLSDSKNLVIDGDTPDLVSVAAADATYKVDDNIDITVTWDEAVTVTDTPTLTLSNGATATYQSGTGNAALVFRYTVAGADTNTTDLQVSSYGGTIKDAAGNTAEAASGDLGAVIVDTDTPDFVSVAATDGTYKVGDDIAITVTYDEVVVGTGSALTLSNGATAVYTSGSGSAAMVYTYTVVEDQTNSADLSVSSYTGTLADAAGNAAEAASGDLGAVIVDANSPGFQSVAAADATYKVDDNIDITVTWDEAVTVTDTPTLTLSNGATATYQSGTGNAALVFRYTVVEDQTNSADLSVSSYSGTIKDAAGNTAEAASGDLGAVIVDANSPGFHQ